MVKQSEREFYAQQSSNVRATKQDADQSFIVDNYGGLNKTSPSINLPLTDSPEMVNITVGISGTLKKRGGSFVRRSTSTHPNGVYSTSYTLLNDSVILVQKQGTSLDISLISSKSTLTTNTTIKTFTNVWASTSASSKPVGVWTTENRPRHIMVIGNHVPIEFEISEVEAVGDGDTTIQIPGDYTNNWASTNTFCVYGDSNVVSCSSISHTSGTTTFTFSSSIPNNQKVVIIQVGWHWWAESIKRTAEQLYASTYRFNTSVEADANVEIPTEIRRGLEADSRILDSLLDYGKKLCRVLQNNTVGATEFTYDQTPVSSSEFAFSNQVYTDGSDNITPGTAYLTFGGISGSGTSPPTPVHIVRQIYLPFNGGEKIDADNLAVVDSAGFVWEARYDATRAANTTSNKYYWVLDDTLSVETTSTNPVQIIEFSGGYPYGIDTEFVEIINKEPGSFVGSSANSTYYSPKVAGTYKPWEGASTYANYRTGVFPSIVSIYQDRLCLSGYSSAPLVVLFSNSADNGTRYYYQNFQVDFDDTTIDTNPVELSLEGNLDDFVTGGLTWYNSFFLFTRRSVRRIHGGDSVAISPTNNFQNVIASVGCYSRHGFVRTDRNVLFVSNSGLYSISILEQTGDYYASNISLKVEDYFIESSNKPQNTWIFYNQLVDTVYVGLIHEDIHVPDRLLVLFNERSAWSVYTLHDGYFLGVGGCSDTFRTFIDVVIRDTDVGSEPSSSSIVLNTEFEMEDLVTDLSYKPSYSTIEAGSESWSIYPSVQINVPANSERRFSLNKESQDSGYTNLGFRPLPLSDYEEHLQFRVYNGVSWETITQSNDDIEIDCFNNSVFVLRYPWESGYTLEVTLLNGDGNVPIHVFRDNYEITSECTITESVNNRITVTVDPSNDNNATYLVGSTIPCWHFTPTFSRVVNPTLKRGVHYVGYYDNSDFHDFYTYSDVNTSADQSPSEISGKYKQTVGVELGVLYNDSRSGIYESEVYGKENLVWDVSTFNSFSSSFRNQKNDIVRTSIPIIGVGYTFQCVNFSLSTDVFELIGYHVLTRQKGRNSVYWY